jgi:hypothetical protein
MTMATIPLKFPIIVNDLVVSELTLPERLKLKHMRAMDNASGDIGKISALIGSLTELPNSAIDQIDVEDFNAIAEVAGGFLSQSQAIGKL